MLGELSRRRLLGYTTAVEARRPGLSKANRPRRGAFASLLDQMVGNESALDALVFAYESLPTPERLAMMQAVVQDADRPAQAITALLTVEPDPGLRKRLEALLHKHAGLQQSAGIWGTPERGGANLSHWLRGSDPESLRISWARNEIVSIEIESKVESSFGIVPVDPEQVVAAVAPMIWRYVRSGRALPPGIDRFAGFF
jgi:hypothetical protein